MSTRAVFIQFHVFVSCGVILCWLAALAIYVARRHRQHVLIGRLFMVMVVASTVSAVGLAADARDSYGILFVLQPLLLCLSAGAQFLPSRRWVRALACAELVVAAGVLMGFARMLASRDAIDVIAFAWAGLTLAALAVDDLRTGQRPKWRSHGYRMLAVGWFYVSELCIFVFDPHPSVIAWAVASVLPACMAVWIGRQRGHAFSTKRVVPDVAGDAVPASRLSAEPVRHG